MSVGNVGAAKVTGNWGGTFTGKSTVHVQRSITPEDLAKHLATQHPGLQTNEEQALKALFRDNPGLEAGKKIRGGTALTLNLEGAAEQAVGFTFRVGENVAENREGAAAYGKVKDTYEKKVAQPLSDWMTGVRTANVTMTGGKFEDWTPAQKKTVANMIGELHKEPEKALADRVLDKGYEKLMGKLEDVIDPAAKGPLAVMKKAAEEGPKALFESLRESNLASEVADLRAFVSSSEVVAQYPDGLTVDELQDALTSNRFAGHATSNLAKTHASAEHSAAVTMLYMGAFQNEGRVRLE